MFLVEEIKADALEAYLTATSVLCAPHVGFVLMEDRFLQASFDNFHLTEVLPTYADFEAAKKAAEEEEEEEDMLKEDIPDDDEEDDSSDYKPKKSASKPKQAARNKRYTDL